MGGVAYRVLANVLFRLLWFRVAPPNGVILQRGQAIRMFQLIDQVRGAVNAPPIHEVVIVPDLNAGVAQIPGLGLLGGNKNYLVIGLPMLYVLSKEQFRAAFAGLPPRNAVLVSHACQA